MPSPNLMRAQVGLQADHGTAVDPTVDFPAIVDYSDDRQLYEAAYDAGTIAPTTIVAQTAQETSLTTSGLAYFEIIPICLNSAFADVASSGSYIHTYTVSPTTPGTPKPCTWLVGTTGTNLGATGPAVKLKDMYCQELVLTGNMNDKTIQHKSSWIGTTYDDNSAAGFAFASVGLIPTLGPMLFLNGALSIDDAGTTGGAFTTMTAFACTLRDWELTIRPGIERRYCGDSAATVMAGIINVPPVITFKADMRLLNTYYAVTKAKRDAGTYQELQLTISGTTRSLVARLTGRWTELATAHSRKNDEVVLDGTFTAQIPHTQTTTPFYASFVNTSLLNWSA